MIKIKIGAKQVEKFFTENDDEVTRLTTKGALPEGCSLMGSRFDSRDDSLELSFDDGLEEVALFTLETK